jgi:vacuolar protein sorting-associated protein 72
VPTTAAPAEQPAAGTPSGDNPPPAKTDPSAARNAIIFQNFDENAIKDKTIQTQIIFGRKMNRLPSKPPSSSSHHSILSFRLDSFFRTHYTL